MPIGQLKNRYAVLSSDRSAVLDRARECAQVTIPFLYPLEGSTQTTKFPTPWQSFGARCVNNLSSKLILSQFPPNTPFFRLVVDDFARDALGASAGEVDEGLSKIERTVMSTVETNAMRPALSEALKHLVVSGNVMLYLSPKLKLRVFPLYQYVAKRDPEGHLLEGIVREVISPMEVPASVRSAVVEKARTAAAGSQRPSHQDAIELYTGIERTPTGYRTWQECEGILLPDSLSSSPVDELRWMPLRWTTIDGEDYGRGYVEQYLGDLKSLEALQQAIVEGSAAAARVLFLVRPNSTTKKEVIANAPSGTVASGNADDVSVVQMEKYSDFRIAREVMNDLVQGLSYAFLLNTAVQRQAERVTAEEIRYMVTELESSLGGVYATLSQELQLPFVSLLLSTLASQERLPKLPKGVAKPAITTGVEALGRGNDANRMRTFLQSFAGLPEPVIERVFTKLNEEELIKRNAAAAQIDHTNLILSDEQVQERQQQQMAQQAAVAAAPQVARGAMEQAAAQ